LGLISSACRSQCPDATNDIIGDNRAMANDHRNPCRTSAMSEHKATIDWKRVTPDFAYETYNRDHDWSFDAGVTVRASATTAYQGNPACVDPEEAFVASLSSCHMLTFLAITAVKKLVVDAYQDEAVGVLAKDAGGRLAITRVTLRP